MANVVDCTGSDFKGISNPYTGEEMLVKMVVTRDGSAMFFAPDTYSTTQEFGSVPEARRMWSRVDGVFGCRPEDEPARCAYTGELLEPQDGGSYSGGFDPTVFHARDEFLYYATMRDGKAVRPVPVRDSVRVTSVSESAPSPVVREPDYVEGAIEAAGEAIKKSGVKLEKRSTVQSGLDLKKSKAKKRG